MGSGAEAMFIMSVIQLFDFSHKQIKIKMKLPVPVMPVSSLSLPVSPNPPHLPLPHTLESYKGLRK